MKNSTQRHRIVVLACNAQRIVPMLWLLRLAGTVPVAALSLPHLPRFLSCPRGHMAR